MKLGSALRRDLEATLGEALGAAFRISSVRAVGGGCINDGSILESSAGTRAFVKVNSDAPPRFFECEAEGLAALAEARAVRVPKVYAARPAQEDRPAFLVMEALGLGQKSGAWAERLGEQLAALHRHSADAYGFTADNYIGSTPQPNPWSADWIDFFVRQRLRWQGQLLERDGLLERDLGSRLERLCARLGDLLTLPDERPALIHGDLWSGNLLALADGSPAIIDPAVYYGCREADLAMMELFGSPPRRFFEAYEHAFPLAPGYSERRPLYNLYHLLNHAHLFGASYLGSVEQILRRYTG